MQDMRTHHEGKQRTRHSMSTTDQSKEEYDETTLYEIRIKGHLDPRWADRFTGMTLTQVDNGVTLLTGPVTDQSALHGLLRAVRDLGMTLLSVTRIEPEQAEAQPVIP
jgi:hypothetical protein